ncbi:YajD family HNH nuclease [Metallibacterium scheffleri]|uniref:Putative HNH nuclease YajD n=1 Tax=Metallibacterium scheffleri TaxID=993689 RepID=A0A4S3KKI7_9GAMM|nr:YajD family HNH nuclease [Metallibacterium scheffleri]THD09345.1 HNH endonuclease [Metallibacterium scheffleri]
MHPPKATPDHARLDRVVADARRAAETRNNGYRERALKMYPWICGRCAREFTRANVQELTVHHRNHNHDDNPADGSNWELLCVYCHDNEHARHVDHAAGSMGSAAAPAAATAQPFAGLQALLEKRGKG